MSVHSRQPKAQRQSKSPKAQAQHATQTPQSEPAQPSPQNPQTQPAARVPRLRFPGFAGEWEGQKFTDIYEFKTAYAFTREHLNYEHGSVQSIHYGDIHTKFATLFSIDRETVPYINPTISLEKIRSENYCKEGDLIFAKSSEDVDEAGKSIEIVALKNKKLLAGLDTILARQKKHIFVTGFAGYLFQSSLIRSQIQLEAQGTKIVHITAKRIEQIRLLFPKDKAEQQKIATCLSSIDDLINAQTQKIDALKKHKKALLQKLFPADGATEPRLRFPGFTGEWDLRKLDDLCTNIFNGGTPNTEKLEYWNGDILWLTPAEMGENKNQFVYDTNRKITKQGLKNCSSKLLPVNSVILSTRAPIGHLAINKKETAINQGCRGLVPKETLDYKFLYYCLLISKVKLINLGSGSTFRELSGQELKNFQITFPSFAEQQKIATCLSTLDDLISAEHQKYIALKTHKKALLQRLFPQTEQLLHFASFVSNAEEKSH